MTFKEFFNTASGSAPYPYQIGFAEAKDVPLLLRAPTGAGKTATVVLGWLWRRRHGKSGAPRRLIYCLPMRVLVEQSHREAKKWLANLGLTDEVDLHLLMGGVDAEQWFLHPERPAILIGTQDMLLSRALNRGYAASRFHWPIDFGLLNNDCLWVFDEPQLMGSGVSTSAQLAGLRHDLKTLGDCPSIWMSATLEPKWLDTIDFVGKFPESVLELTDEDYAPSRPLDARMTAEKKLLPAAVSATKDCKEAVKAIAAKHIAGTQTLVVVNTVERAKTIFAGLKKEKKLPKDILLVHSRFRPNERERLNKLLTASATDRIIVATQVVEAGVDISARTLFFELAPWASVVQRIGRCNRTGNDGPGQVFWIDVASDDKSARPYRPADLDFAREQLIKLEGEDVSPSSLDEFKKRQKIELPFEHKHVLRRRDLLDLFDTTPDLSGNDIDIARFVRGDDPETDLQVFWRVVGAKGPPTDEPAPERKELCSVPVPSAREFVKESKLDAYVWDYLDERWRTIRERELRPGMIILLPTAAGGYSDLGWDPDSKSDVDPAGPSLTEELESTGSDPVSSGPPLPISVHTENVCRQLDAFLASVPLPDSWRTHLRQAARWHDVGKAHRAFQRGLRRANEDLATDQLWAKSGTRARLRHGRKYFRHELASALAVLQHGLPFAVAYLVATHHGKVRLGIRSLPEECEPDDEARLFALGVHDGDDLPAVDLGGESSSAMKLDLSPMLLGGEESWTARSLALLQEIGPFQLAYLESLLRAADLLASKNEREEANRA